VISGIPRDIDEMWDYYAACSDNSLPTFRVKISVPSSGAKKSKQGNLLRKTVEKLQMLLILHNNIG